MGKCYLHACIVIPTFWHRIFPGMKQILIQRGRVIDPASGFDQTADVLLSDGIVVDIGSISPEDASAEFEIIDAEAIQARRHGSNSFRPQNDLR